METISDNNNALMKRQEMVFESDKNLSFDDAKKEVAGKVGKPEENIDVYNVKGGFGNQKFIISANVYDSKEDLNSIKNMELSKKARGEKVEEKVEEDLGSPVEKEVKESEEDTEKTTEGDAGESSENENKPAEGKSEEEQKGEQPIENAIEDNTGDHSDGDNKKDNLEIGADSTSSNSNNDPVDNSE